MNARDPINELAALLNLGPKSSSWLQGSGITSVAQLQDLGPVVAYRLVKSTIGRPVSLNLLWALAAGLEQRDWRELTQAEKDQLLAQLKALG